MVFIIVKSIIFARRTKCKYAVTNQLLFVTFVKANLIQPKEKRTLTLKFLGDFVLIKKNILICIFVLYNF